MHFFLHSTSHGAFQHEVQELHERLSTKVFPKLQLLVSKVGGQVKILLQVLLKTRE
jgi:hypothetical protein